MIVALAETSAGGNLTLHLRRDDVHRLEGWTAVLGVEATELRADVEVEVDDLCVVVLPGGEVRERGSEAVQVDVPSENARTKIAHGT